MLYNYKKWPEDNNELLIKLLLFLVSPLLGFVYSLKRIGTRSSYIIFFLFSIFFGLAFTVSNVSTKGISVDGSFYRMTFEQICGWQEGGFLLDLKEFFSFETTKKDFGFEMLSFVISRFTDNYHILFFVLAAIFSFFQLKSLKFLTSNKNFHSGLYCLILAGLFTWNSIFNINGCRFWTSAWIIAYCYFQVFVNDKKYYLLLALITPIIHGSYWGVIALFFLAYVCRFAYKISSNVLIIVFILSFLFSSLSVGYVQLSADYLPDFLNPTIDFYTDETNLGRLNIGGGIHGFFQTLVRITVSVLTIILIINRNIIIKSSSRNLFLGLLVLQSFANFTMTIPSLGNRFIILAYPMISYIWLDNIGIKKYRKIIYALPVIWIMEIFDFGRLYLLVTDYSFYFLSPLYTLIKALV